MNWYKLELDTKIEEFYKQKCKKHYNTYHYLVTTTVVIVLGQNDK